MSDDERAARLTRLREALAACADLVSWEDTDAVDNILAEFVGVCGHFDHERGCQCESDE